MVIKVTNLPLLFLNFWNYFNFNDMEDLKMAPVLLKYMSGFCMCANEHNNTPE